MPLQNHNNFQTLHRGKVWKQYFFPETSPKVKNSITEKGKLAVLIGVTIRNFGIQLMEKEGIDVEYYNAKKINQRL